MNPTDPKHPFSRLAAAARTVRDERDATAPYGFAARVVALAMTQERRVASLLDLFALRAVGVACLLALLSVAVNYSALSGGGAFANSDDNDGLLNDDTVALVLNLTD